MHQLIKIGFLICLFSTVMAAYQDWTYEIIDIECESENEDLLTIELETTRVDRDDYRVSGTIDVKTDFTDEEFGEISILRSATGSNDYKNTPFHIPKSTLSQMMNGYYKAFLMPFLKECAPQAPQFEGTFTPPLKPVKIKATNCVGDDSKYPPIMQAGYYKVIANLTGQANASIVVVMRVEKKIF